MAAQGFKFPTQQSEYFVPQGGLDLVSPPMLLPNGVAFEAENWECNVEAGYSRIGGYDKYVDGKTASEMDFRVAIISVTAGTIFSGETLKGSESGSTMVFAVRHDGPFVVTGGETNMAIYVSSVVGQFKEGEILDREPGLSPASIFLDAPPDYPAEATIEENEAARARAEAYMRKYMDKPGSGQYGPFLGVVEVGANPLGTDMTVGPILGVFVMSDVPYVVRAKNPALSIGGNTNAVFVRPARPIGAINRYWELAQDQPDIPTDGAKFEFVLSNFADPSLDPVMFGVSGTSKAFFYTGATFGFMTTGMPDDRPSHICVHQNRVFLAFKGSLQCSSVKDSSLEAAFPHLTWDAVLGAGEWAMGSDITGLLTLTGSENNPALLISTEDRLFILYGSSTDPASAQMFKLVEFSANTGGLEKTLQWMGQPVFQNAFGLTMLATSNAFGGFQESSISGRIKPFLDARRGTATTSMICRDKNQYRIFFRDGTALYVTFRQGQVIGMFTQRLKHRVTCGWSCRLSDNTELMLIGTEDGGLYKLDVGTSFAGEPISHYIRFAFNQLRSPRVDKHFKRTMVEAFSPGYARVLIGYDRDYGGNRRDVSEETNIQSPDFSSAGFWDAETQEWDSGFWDASVTTPIAVETPGTGSNFSLRLRGEDAVSHPLTITGVLIDYTVRKAKRSI